MRDITLTWDDPNLIEKGYRVYRSKSPMDINNMPTPIGTVNANTTEFIDKDQTIGDTNYYRVSAWIDGHEVFSEEIEIEVNDYFYYLLNSDDQKVYKLSSSGIPLWSSDPMGGVPSALMVNESGVYASTNDSTKYFMRLELDTGVRQYRTTYERGVTFIEDAGDGNIYVSHSYRLLLLNPTNGTGTQVYYSSDWIRDVNFNGNNVSVSSGNSTGSRYARLLNKTNWTPFINKSISTVSNNSITTDNAWVLYINNGELVSYNNTNGSLINSKFYRSNPIDLINIHVDNTFIFVDRNGVTIFNEDLDVLQFSEIIDNIKYASILRNELHLLSTNNEIIIFSLLTMTETKRVSLPYNVTKLSTHSR